MNGSPMTHDDHELREILEQLLDHDEDITAREVARRHPTLRAASSITRSEGRRTMLLTYQREQRRLRQWSERNRKSGGDSIERALVGRDKRIAELEAQVEILIGSHVAMLRAVGELGGFNTWSRFFESSAAARAVLTDLDAMPNSEVIPIRDRPRPRND
jgi:hypothetical protein